MKRTRVAVGALAALAALTTGLTACTGGDGGGTAGPPTTGSTSPEGRAPETVPADRADVVPVSVDGATTVATVDPRYLSVAIDTAQVVGGRFWDPAGSADAVAGGSTRIPPVDLSRPPLRTLLRALAPAYLRIGGTAADQVHVDLSDTPTSTPPHPGDEVLTRAQWDGVGDLATATGLDLLVTVSAGPGVRDADKAWRPDEAEALIGYSARKGMPVGAWSLGNEPNYFPVLYGGPDATQLAAEYERFAEVVRRLDPDAKVVGPASAYWPVTGELFPVVGPFLAAGGGRTVDAVTWHWYPQQSSRCPGASRRADPATALDPAFLGEVDRWAAAVEAARDASAPGTPIWLEETANAQCGGAPGLSDRVAAGLWWFDQLGRLALRGQEVVVRQNLSGADYALLREPDLQPNPDYWTSVLWKRLMGTGVLRATAPAGAPTLRTYAHCTPGRPGATTVALANLDRDRPVPVRLRSSGGAPLEVWLLDGPDLLGRELRLNGVPVALGPDGDLPPLEPATTDGDAIELPPASFGFVVVPDARGRGVPVTTLLADVVAVADRVAATAARNAKRDALADLVGALAPDEVEPVIGFLSGAPRQGRIGVGWATVAAVEVGPAPTPTLTVDDLDTTLTRLAGTRGAGSAAARHELLTRLLERATAAEADFVRRLLVGELRQGASDGVVTDAVARAAGVPAAAVRRAVMLGGDLGRTARVALTEGRPGLDRVGLRVGRAVQPMLAATAEGVDDALGDDPASVEWKLDGARIQVHRSGDEVRVFTRNLNDVTARLPEVVTRVRALPAHTLVLDGEVLSLVDGTRPRAFQETMSRFGRDDAASSAVGLAPFFFDVLHADGTDLVDRPLVDRLAVLDEVAHPLRIPGIVTADAGEAAAFLDQALAAGHEGVMVKDAASPYEAGRRGRAWRKVKPVHTLDLVVLAAEWGHGRRRGWLSNLHLGARGDDGFVMVGKTFKGLTDELLTWQTQALLDRELGREGIVVHVRPELVVEIGLDGVQRSARYPGGVALRFARVRRYRPDKAAADADTIDAVRALLAR